MGEEHVRNENKTSTPEFAYRISGGHFVLTEVTTRLNFPTVQFVFRIRFTMEFPDVGKSSVLSTKVPLRRAHPKMEIGGFVTETEIVPSVSMVKFPGKKLRRFQK